MAANSFAHFLKQLGRPALAGEIMPTQDQTTRLRHIEEVLGIQPLKEEKTEEKDHGKVY
jgi:hypothetical protein